MNQVIGKLLGSLPLAGWEAADASGWQNKRTIPEKTEKKLEVSLCVDFQ